LQREDAGQREHDLREVFNGLRYIVKTGAPWRWMPNDLPRWAAVYQQTQRWLAAGCLESRTLRSTLESGEPAGHDRGKRRRDSKIHIGPSAALHVTLASAEARRGGTARAYRAGRHNDTVELAWVDQGYTGEQTANAAGS
jgi:transposase